ncbi:EG45-like domain containing protein [Primulina eburnea]|uniref:EG45-like domain containing protein n=1 Tax=Primulina eburnea TaxID=1245227 RepID=UPI003C6C7EBB
MIEMAYDICKYYILNQIYCHFRMSHLRIWLSVLLLLLRHHVQLGGADVGTASVYYQPYTPTACYGDDFSQFPTSGLFAAVGEGLWDNSAACGRQYLVRCISAVDPGTCIPGSQIQIKIVDRAETSVSRPSFDGTGLVLSNVAFEALANPIPYVDYLNVEFLQI